MSIKISHRSTHIWISVVLAIPILIVALTAIFLAHDKSLGLKKITVNANWLPGYQTTVKKDDAEIRAWLATADFNYVGTRKGLYRWQNDTLIPVPGFMGMEIRQILAAPQGILVVGKEGLWLEHNDDFQQLYRGEIWNAQLQENGRIILSTKGEGLLNTEDQGVSWKAVNLPALHQQLDDFMQQTPYNITLGKLVMDLHTGKAFLGKEWEWIWIDLVGFVMALLALTGLVMWWRTQRKKTMHNT